MAAPALALIGSVKRKYCECLPVSKHWTGWFSLDSSTLSTVEVFCSLQDRDEMQPGLAWPALNWPGGSVETVERVETIVNNWCDGAREPWSSAVRGLHHHSHHSLCCRPEAAATLGGGRGEGLYQLLGCIMVQCCEVYHQYPTSLSLL